MILVIIVQPYSGVTWFFAIRNHSPPSCGTAQTAASAAGRRGYPTTAASQEGPALFSSGTLSQKTLCSPDTVSQAWLSHKCIYVPSGFPRFGCFKYFSGTHSKCCLCLCKCSRCFNKECILYWKSPKDTNVCTNEWTVSECPSIAHKRAKAPLRQVSRLAACLLLWLPSSWLARTIAMGY